MTRPNRRNYYRVLHVQPDAHAAVIRTAYRTLMQKLRLHPDLGGDGATAILVNEAYAVLSDPARRAAYDAQFDLRHRPAARTVGATDARTVQPHASKGTVQNAPPALAGAQPACPFCTAALPGAAPRPARCGACASPLTPPPPAERLAATRRSFERHTIQTAAEYFAPGDAIPRPATLVDFSPRGAQLAAGDAARAGLVLALKTPLFDALARVVASEPAPAAPGRRLLRLEFLTLALTASTGSLVSTQA